MASDAVIRSMLQRRVRGLLKDIDDLQVRLLLLYVRLIRLYRKAYLESFVVIIVVVVVVKKRKQILLIAM